MSNAEIRRQLGNMPTGTNDMSQYEFRVERKTPFDWAVSALEVWPKECMRDDDKQADRLCVL